MKKFLIKIIYILCYVSLSWSDIFYLNQPIASSLNIGNAKYSSNSLNGLSLDYAFSIFDSDTSKYSFLIGASYSLTPYNASNQTINSNLKLGFYYIMGRFKLNNKLSSWFSIGATSTNIDYMKLHLPYSYHIYHNEQGDCIEDSCVEWENNTCITYICTQYEYNNYYEEAPSYINNAEPFEFKDVDSAGNIGIHFGIDYKISDRLSIGISHFYHNIGKYIGYNQSVFLYKTLDLNIQISYLRFGIHF